MRIIRSALAGRAAFQPVEHKCIHIMFKSDIPIGTAARLSYHFHDMRYRRFLCMASSYNHGCFVRPIRLSSVLYRFYAAHNAIPMLGGCFIYHGIMGCHQCSHVTMWFIADDEGFEPPEPFGSLVFKTSSIDHSDNHPVRSTSSMISHEFNSCKSVCRDLSWLFLLNTYSIISHERMLSNSRMEFFNHVVDGCL